MLVTLYRRRGILLAYLEGLPDETALRVAGFTYVVETEAAVSVARAVLVDAAIGFATAAPVLIAKFFLFAFVVYGLLFRPEAVRKAVLGVVPDSHAGDVRAFHERVRDTLYGIYVVQAATAVVTFLAALVVFYLFGFSAFFTLAVLAGVLQFLPIVGPSVVVVGVGAGEYLTGDPGTAALVLVVGLVVVAALPDLVVRPRLARETAGLAASLYFVGFIAGGLSFGAVGIIAGPVVVAVLVEAVEIASTANEWYPDEPVLGID